MQYSKKRIYHQIQKRTIGKYLVTFILLKYQAKINKNKENDLIR